MKAKIMINKSHTIVFNGFTVQVGMIYGHDVHGKQFVSNGKIYNGNVDVYMIDCIDIFGKIKWVSRKFGEGSEMFDVIKRGINKRGNSILNAVIYANSAKLESDRWDNMAKRNGSVLSNGCNSRHYGYVMTRKECY